MSKNLQDTRSQSLGRPLKRELTLEEKYARMEAQNALLKAVNEFLKRIRFAERGQNKGQNCHLIRNMSLSVPSLRNINSIVWSTTYAR